MLEKENILTIVLNMKEKKKEEKLALELNLESCAILFSKPCILLLSSLFLSLKIALTSLIYKL